MPYPNEHACRLNSPDKYDRFARKNCDRKVSGKCVDVIYGIKEGKTEVQALRYPKDSWEAAAARSHCKDEGGTFEAASGGEAMVQLVRTKGTTGEYGPLHEMQMTEIVAWFKANSDKEGNVADGIVLYGDALLKAAPKEAQEEELFEWVMSDYTLDRDMERIDPTGWDLKNYKKNPVVLWGHNPNIPAIGVALDAGVDKERGLLTGRIKFSSKEVDPFAWMIKEKIREGILKTGSVGFRPIKVEIVEGDEGKGTKPSEQARLIHRKQELYEFSIVNIPANTNAAIRRDAASEYLHIDLESPIPGTTTTVGSTVNGDDITAWSVRGKGYKQQDGWVDPDHARLEKQIADVVDVLAEMRKTSQGFAVPPEAQKALLEIAAAWREDKEETVIEEPEKKVATGILVDMALRLDEIETAVQGLVERVGVAEPQSKQPASFYDELFSGSRPTPSALDKLLAPRKNKTEEQD